MNSKKVSVVIPIYNERDNIIKLLEEVLKVIDSQASDEIILIDDCSTDDSVKLIREYQNKSDSNIILVQHQNRSGQSASLLTGIIKANNGLIITLDGDGQNDPIDIKRMRNVWSENEDNELLLIIGNRVTRKDGFSKKFASKLALYIRRIILKDGTPDTGCGIKLFNKDLFLCLPYFDHIHRFLPALVKRQGGKIISVPVSHRSRIGGKSKYTNWQRLRVGIMDLWGVFWLIKRSPFPIKILDNEVIKHKKDKEQKWIK